ncbi:MAG: acyl-CoA dehydrogenase family protein [Gammaproteobacteria bacterium]
MDFSLSEEQQAFQAMAYDFAQQELAPYASEWDKTHFFPVDTLRKAAQLGLATIYTRDDLGGSNLSRLDAALVFEQLASACVSTAAYLSIHNMVAWIIDQYGSESLRQQWLPRMATMDIFASYCLTEPGSGSDAAALQTTARLDGETFILNGTKAFISGGSVSDIYACMVRTGDAGARGISCILVEKNTPGLSFGQPEQKLGWHSQPTTMVYFENCRVPASNLIGELGKGFNIALSALNGGRVNIGACSLGGAQACVRLTRQYMQERQQFGQALDKFQALQFRYADMFTDLEAARLMVYRAAAALDTGHNEAPLYCAMAKRYASDIAFDISDRALQLYGGYGYLQDYPIERYFRDLRVHRILEGTNEIMRLIIARRVLDNAFQFTN